MPRLASPPLPSPHEVFSSSLAMVSSCLSSEKEEISWLCSLPPQLTKFSFFPPHGKAEMLLQTTKWSFFPDTCAVSASISHWKSNSIALPQDSRHSRPRCHTDHFPHVVFLWNHSFLLLCFQTTETVTVCGRAGNMWGFLHVLCSEIKEGKKRNSLLSSQMCYTSTTSHRWPGLDSS